MSILRTRMLMIFYRELSQLVGSGVTIIEAMNILSNQAGDFRLKRIAAEMKEYLSGGSSLGDAFAKFPDIFPSLHINIIKYSETAGRPAQGLGSMADYLEKEYAMQQGLIAGLAYPVVLLHAAIFLLPIINAVSCGIGAYILGVLSMLVPIYGFVFLIYAASRMRRFEQFKTAFDSFVLSIPKIGGIVRQFVLTRFIRALQVLSASGVSIISGWRMAAEACGNNVIKTALLRGLPFIENGESLSRAFIETRVFRPAMIGMITAAEKSGSIVGALNSIAVFSDKENETAVAVLVRIIPIFVYLAVAGYIGFRIISFYVGYFNRIFSLPF